MAARRIDIHAHILFPEVMGRCGAAGPEMGVRDGVQFFRSGDDVGGCGRPDAAFSVRGQRLALMNRRGADRRPRRPDPLG